MMEPVLVNGDSAQRKRILRWVVIAAVVALAVLVVPRLVLGGGEEPAVTFTKAEDASDPDAVEPGGEVVEVVDAFSTRNPFTPLVAAAAAGPAAPSQPEVPATSDPVVLPEVPVDLGGYPVDPAPLPPTAPPTTAAPAPTPPAPTGQVRFALLEVFQDPAGQVLARTRVGDVTSEVVVGRDFLDRYRFVSADLTARCASFLFGDARFELCEGEETLT